MFAITGETGEPMAAPCNCLWNFVLKQKTRLVKVNSKSLMNFSVGILQILVKLVQVEIFQLITCSATDGGMLVKRALTSIKTEVFFFWIYWEMFNFLDEVYTIFNKGWSLATVILKNFSDEFGSAVCCCATSWNCGAHRHVVFCGF